MMSSITFPGSTLADAREAKEKSLQDVYQDIHVPIEHLRAIEAGLLHELPGNTYGLGFLRTYCLYLGLDPSPFVDQYRLYTAVRPQRRGMSFGSMTPLKSRPLWLGEVFTWGTLCAVLLLGWVTYTMVVQPWVRESETRVEAGTFEVNPGNLWDTETFGLE